MFQQFRLLNIFGRSKDLSFISDLGLDVECVSKYGPIFTNEIFSNGRQIYPLAELY